MSGPVGDAGEWRLERVASGESARQVPLRRALGCFVVMALLLAACGSGETDDAGGGDTDGDEIAATDDGDDTATAEDVGEDDGADSFPHVVDGVLQPLASGFPDQPITLWNAWEPGNDDDILNQTIARAGAKYSPVDIQADTQQMGPGLHYELVPFLEDRPGATDGYHLYATSWFGLGTRLFTLESLADVPFDELYDRLNPINRMLATPFAIFTSQDSPYTSIEELESYMRDNPGELVLSGSAPGSGTHSTAVVWSRQAGVEFTYLPSESNAEIEQLLLGGGADIGVAPLQPGYQEQFNVLMTSGEAKLQGFDDVPSATEQGYTIPSGSETGYGTLPDVPQEHIEWLTEWLRMVSEDPEFLDAYAQYDTTYVGPDQVEEDRQAVLEHFVPVLEDQGLVVRDDY